MEKWQEFHEGRNKNAVESCELLEIEGLSNPGMGIDQAGEKTMEGSDESVIATASIIRKTNCMQKSC